MKIVAIVQARMGSTRLPGKVMKLIMGLPMIEIMLARLSMSTLINQVIVATSIDQSNQPLIEHVRSLGIEIFQGSENDVLGRYLDAARTYEADVIVRVTGDCPLIDPEIIDEVIEIFLKSNVDYASNILPPSYPDGLDVEVFKFNALLSSSIATNEKSDREHVTPYIRRSDDYSKVNILNNEDLSNERWTVDEPEDLALIQDIFENFHPNKYFGWREVQNLKITKSELFNINSMHKRNEGVSMGIGQKLWNRAKKVIPGGNMLLSKRAEMFLPGMWPAYFSKAKGCNVWDLDGNKYIDMSIMGIGTNTLGYGNDQVDDAVRKVINDGNMATFNCPEEVYLAEKLIEMHPWADMVRLARTGGEANAIAIRIARAASGRDKVAVCGYHGWHDWYLSANLGDDKSLDGHLLPGLEPNGVPRSLKNTVIPFSYNNFEELERLVSVHDIGAIKMEVSRNKGPENNFLQKVRQLATDRNIVLIFDECTSGFRQAYGGLHKLYGVEPDIAIFGKALGNGYAITAIIGRREVMESAQSTFISSTFWTERIGPAAALKTLEVMEKLQSWDLITSAGKSITKGWQEIAANNKLEIETWGLPALTGFTFKSANNLKYKTYITQEMLKKGYLASNSIYLCTEHTADLINSYFDQLELIFRKIKDFELGDDVDAHLPNGVCHSGFARLN